MLIPVAGATATLLLLHFAASAITTLLAHFLRLPSLLLHGLHTYIHPDSLPRSSSSPAAALRAPSDHSSGDLKPRRRRKSGELPGDPSAPAQLLRLRLSHTHLLSRTRFPLYRSAFLSSVASLPLLLLSSPFAPFSLLAAGHLLFSLAAVSFAATRRTDRLFAPLAALFGLLSSLLITSSPSVVGFSLGKANAGIVAALAGAATGLVVAPAARFARAFWIGTDQLRLRLETLSCGSPAQALLHFSLISSFTVPLIWVEPISAVLSPELKRFRPWALAAAAASQLAALRPGLQTYMNEAVLCWYQRLHASKVTDLDYGRAKVFLHDHYLCVVALQLFAPPAAVLLLLGLSQVRGNLFSGLLFVGSGLVDWSDPVKELSLFMAWWIMFVWAILAMSNLALYRCRFLYVS